MKVNLTYSKDGSSFKLKLKPKKRMADNKYDKLKPIIENAGWHWRESEQAFMFYGEIDEYYNKLQKNAVLCNTHSYCRRNDYIE